MHVDNMGAYSIPPETGRSFSSVVVAWLTPCNTHPIWFRHLRLRHRGQYHAAFREEYEFRQRRLCVLSGSRLVVPWSQDWEIDLN